MEATTSDMKAVGRVLRDRSAGDRAYAAEVIRLTAFTKEEARLALHSGAAVEKVRHLEVAKFGLSELEAYVEGLSWMSIDNLAAFKDDLGRLEQTYRAFGYYRLAGVA